MFKKLPYLLGATLLLAGCGAAATADAEAPQATPRSVDNPIGTTEVPLSPQNVIALDEYAAVQLLSIGVKPDKVYGTVDSTISVAVLESAGVEVTPDTSFLQSPNIEKLAADAPDLIVLSNAGPLPEWVEQFSGVAPTVGFDFQGDWQKSLTQAADTFGRTEQAAKVTAALEKSVTEAKSIVPQGDSLSIVFGYNGSLNSPQPGTVMSLIAEQVGLTRPEAETSDTTENVESLTAFSAEALEQHAADTMVLLDEGYYDADYVRDQKLFDRLPQVEADRVFDVSGDIWFASNVFAVQWVIDDLEAIFSGEGEVGTVEQAGTRWQEFSAAVGE